ncbi:RNA polymerase sigma factor [Brevundimonas sp. SORGH_AS_0993]|uniref:RNA polymerase sigma factor n=1 Tax=Brevundimonas sp. SORGH_AS_0993 TaxID=3041794 RepID=UPI002782D02A|nr:sigma-70 family RNA polymerase sigma factor [Brevundimonas sp. SORGH_AS_0993]MDQ1153390.1 RNA polymerase sigma factor (sigma-70 family) [Brevundimonas sp. SORGH_AS_0993]
MSQPLVAPGPNDARAGGRSTEAAFADLTRRLRRPLLQFFRRRAGSPMDAEEMVQDLFVRLLRRADLFSLENVDGYVFEAAANVARDRGRYDQARGHGRHVDIDDLAAPSDAPSAEQVLDGKQQLKRMLAALQALPPRARTIVILRRLENLTYPQIAQRLGISVSAVEKHMVRAMAALKHGLFEETH